MVRTACRQYGDMVYIFKVLQQSVQILTNCFYDDLPSQEQDTTIVKKIIKNASKIGTVFPNMW